MELLVNGLFLTETLTGVQRVGVEVLKELAKIEDLKITVLIPKNVKLNEKVEKNNITYLEIGKFKGNLWEQISLYNYAKKKKLPLLSTGNKCPIRYKNNYVILHDVIFKDMKNMGSKSWVFKMNFIVKSYLKKAKCVYTVSEFTKNRILANYKTKSPIVVIKNGYIPNDNFKEVSIDKDFYLTVGTSNPNKNFKYILSLAKNNPDKSFIVTGKLKDDFIKENNVEEIKNLKFLGYVETNELMYLYKNCKGFILPSLYEGFGLPPLEALAVGCKNVYLSNIEVFKEIYDGVVKFFDPLDYKNTVILDEVKIEEEKLNKLKEECTYKKVTEKIFENIKF